MNITELRAEMAALEAEMSEKAILIPRAQITVGTEGFSIHIDAKYDTFPFDGERYHIIFSETASDCIAEARAYIAALPSPEDQVTREYLSRIAKAVDYATEHSLPDEYVTPLRNVSCAMTDNLLTHTKEPAQ